MIIILNKKYINNLWIKIKIFYQNMINLQLQMKNNCFVMKNIKKIMKYKNIVKIIMIMINLKQCLIFI